jgi:probable F420-dependent oxidoreductase
MRLGLYGLNMFACAEPRVATAIAVSAEEHGLESLWVGEHVVLPDPQRPPSPMKPTDPCLDPIVALANLAVVTHRLRLGTGVIILPQRNPVVLAKQLASLDAVTDGRLIVGVGAGYLAAEMHAIGVPMAQRGQRTDEYLAAMNSLWFDEHPTINGDFVSFADVDAYPRPRQRPLPIVIGGQSRAAHARAVTKGHGWYGFALDVDETTAQLMSLRQLSNELERPTSLGELEISVTPRGVLDRATIEQFEVLGVDRLMPSLPRRADLVGLQDFVEQTAALV